MTQDKSGTITLIFSQSPHPISWFIRWWTDSPYSHVAIRTNDGVYEALINGFNFHPKGEWSSEARASYDIVEVDIPDVDKAREWLDKSVGKQYDFTGLFAYLLPFIKQTREALYCSEAARLCLRAGGLPILDEPMHPGALRWWVKGLKSQVVLIPDSPNN